MGKEIAMPDMEGKEYAVEYCKFAPRCPYATDECRQKRPDAKDMAMAVWFFAVTLCVSRQKKRKISL